MALAIAFVLCGALVLVLFVAVAREPGPSPADTALAYELAWDRLDFSTLYDLSGDELRDGLGRERFVAVKREAFSGRKGRSGRARRVDVVSADVQGDVAHVVTLVDGGDVPARGGGEAGPVGVVHDDVVLERRSGRWVVTAYALRDQGAPGR